MQSFQAGIVANGGGRANCSVALTMAGATSAQSVYYFPKSDIAATAIASRAIDCGSARGYGAIETITATELMVDEIAGELGLDPIEFRLRNVLKTGMKNDAGRGPGRHPTRRGGAARGRRRIRCGLAAPRASRPTTRRIPANITGSASAAIHRRFGNGAEASFAKVEIAPDGRIALSHSGDRDRHRHVLRPGRRVRALARAAGRRVDLAVTEWPELPVETSGDPHAMSQAEQDRLAREPALEPGLCVGVERQQLVLLFHAHDPRSGAHRVSHGLWPAALAIWGAQPIDAPPPESARWSDGSLTLAGMRAAAVGAAGGGSACARLRGRRDGARFQPLAMGGGRFQRGWCFGALAAGRARRCGTAIAQARRSRRSPPRLVAIRCWTGRSVSFPPPQATTRWCRPTTPRSAPWPSSRSTRPAERSRCSSTTPSSNAATCWCRSWCRARSRVAPPAASASRCMKYLPLYEEGPGDGTWNFNRYHLPRGSDVAVWTQTAEVLPPLSDTEPPKGMAEVVVIPIIAAIVNGIAHAIGHRFRTLPVTPDRSWRCLDEPSDPPADGDDQRPAARPDRRAGRHDDDRRAARDARPDRLATRLRPGHVSCLRGDLGSRRSDQRDGADLHHRRRLLRRQAHPHHRGNRADATTRARSSRCRRCSRHFSISSASNAATARRASSTPRRC